ncbi:type IX secretion system anionic LPS delivery protein PorZ [Flavobacterium agrisoli]|uniref:T9SS type A sorting domain-containing protein n=1 Tax=Flavobacterium agrisoli TaxID=2793066 RepID=A0A934PLG6_9FLAO|nr:two-component regulator propeller domain-containing protein [Flavobacterium agrisoli]MBK0369772.1 T9SS type A sorting domain-containing protein [Flavobacterium agrisoli]
MKARVLLCFFLLLVQSFFGQNKLLWQGYFSFNEIKDISQSSSAVLAASENAFFSKNQATNLLETTTTIEGLSGQTISAFYYSEAYQKKVIGYENGLLIVVNQTDGAILKLVDIINKQLSVTAKKINHFTEYNGMLYLSCDFGIVQFNLKTLQFGDTYFIGNSGAEISVKQTAVFQNEIFAATTDGIRKATLSNPNLIDYLQWTVVIPGNWVGVAASNSQLLAVENTGNISRYTASGFSFFQTLPQAAADVRAVNEGFLITTSGTLYVYGGQLNVIRQINSTELSSTENVSLTCATLVNDNIYIGTKENGLYESSLTAMAPFINVTPEGPKRNSIFSLDVVPNSLWAVYGDYTASYNPYPLDTYGLSKLNEGKWLNIPYSEVLEAKSMTRITINPNNENQVYASSFFSGLLKVENDVPQILYNQTNSGLESLTALGPDYIDIRVNATAFDKSGNLWIGNGWVKNGLKVLRANGAWQSYSMTSVLSDPETTSYANMVIDKNSVKWLATNTNGVVGFSENGNLFRKITTGEDTGNLPSVDVRAIALDNRNQLWIGTTKGLRVLSSVNSFQSQNQLTANPIIIEEDGLAQELMYEQSITALAVDGANNKWIGTVDSGVFLVSSNGQKTLYHFTIDNSPLPSNNINDIKINAKTGEVFLATAKGMISFKGTATQANDNLNNLYAYPNPVRPGFTGTVKIAGLIDKANVKITDISGNLVYETTSEGGTIEWDTTAFGKHKVASGVYMIFVACEDGAETKVKKLMIIR